MMKAGNIEKSVDREFEVEERRYRTMETASNKLQVEAKGYLDSLRAMSASQVRIAETMDSLYGDTGGRDDGVSKYYLTSVQELDSETIKALDGPFRETVLEPVSRFCAYFVDINEAVKKRNHKRIDYDQMRHKVKRMTEKPSDDATKLPRLETELQATKTQYEELNSQLKSELPQLIDMRVPYLDPSFEALVKIQLKFCTESYTRLTQVQNYLDASTREEYATGAMDNQVEQALEQMKSLNIASMAN